MGKNVKARIMHTVPHMARIANVVNRSFVLLNSSTVDLAELNFVDAQLINPADSRSEEEVSGALNQLLLAGTAGGV